MTDYKAPPEQWDNMKLYAEDNAYDACFLELRARVEALEAKLPLTAAQSDDNESQHPLLQEIVWIVNEPCDEYTRSRAIIREVASWLAMEWEQNVDYANIADAIAVLKHEADR